jgi:hypothetical protein
MAPTIRPLYGVTIQHACERGDLDEMKELAAQAEAHLAADGDIAAHLEALKAEIAKQEAEQG